MVTSPLRHERNHRSHLSPRIDQRDGDNSGCSGRAPSRGSPGPTNPSANFAARILPPNLTTIAGGNSNQLLAELAESCRALDLHFWLHHSVGRAEATGELVASQPNLWETPRSGALAPRTIHLRTEMHAACHDGDARRHLIQFWQEQLLGWQELGVSGVRCHDPRSLPTQYWAEILAPAQAKSELTALAWLSSASRRERIEAGAVFDFVPSSVAWWDGAEPWLIDEYNAISAVAGLIGFPEDPFAPRRPARLPALPAKSSQLSLASAALLGDGWLMPMGFEFGMEIPFLHVEMEDFVAARNGRTDLQEAVAAANEQAKLLAARAAAIRSLGGCIRRGRRRCLRSPRRSEAWHLRRPPSPQAREGV